MIDRSKQYTAANKRNTTPRDKRNVETSRSTAAAPRIFGFFGKFCFPRQLRLASRLNLWEASPVLGDCCGLFREESGIPNIVHCLLLHGTGPVPSVPLQLLLGVSLRDAKSHFLVYHTRSSTLQFASVHMSSTHTCECVFSCFGSPRMDQFRHHSPHLQYRHTRVAPPSTHKFTERCSNWNHRWNSATLQGRALGLGAVMTGAANLEIARAALRAVHLPTTSNDARRQAHAALAEFMSSLTPEASFQVAHQLLIPLTQGQPLTSDPETLLAFKSSTRRFSEFRRGLVTRRSSVQMCESCL